MGYGRLQQSTALHIRKFGLTSVLVALVAVEMALNLVIGSSAQEVEDAANSAPSGSIA